MRNKSERKRFKKMATESNETPPEEVEVGIDQLMIKVRTPNGHKTRYFRILLRKNVPNKIFFFFNRVHLAKQLTFEKLFLRLNNDQLKISPFDICFSYQGKEIFDFDTPNDLMMEEDAVIQIDYVDNEDKRNEEEWGSENDIYSEYFLFFHLRLLFCMCISCCCS